MRTGLRARVASGLLVGVLAAATACAPDEAPPTAGPGVLRDGVDMVIIDMDHYLTRLGIRRARLLSDTAEYVSESEIHLRPVELIFFDDDGAEISVLTADYGIFYEVPEDMEATGNIVILDRRDDRRLETEQIRYSKGEDRLYGDSPFVLESNAGRTITKGDAFESDPGLDTVRIKGPRGRSERRVDSLTAEPQDSGAAEPQDSAAAEAPDSVVVQDSTAADSTAVVQDSDARDTTARDTAARDTTVRDTTARDTTTIVPDSAARDTTSRASRASAGRLGRTGRGPR